MLDRPFAGSMMAQWSPESSPRCKQRTVLEVPCKPWANHVQTWMHDVHAPRGGYWSRLCQVLLDQVITSPGSNTWLPFVNVYITCSLVYSNMARSAVGRAQGLESEGSEFDPDLHHCCMTPWSNFCKPGILQGMSFMIHKPARFFGRGRLLNLFFGSSQTDHWLSKYGHFKFGGAGVLQIWVYSWFTIWLAQSANSVQTLCKLWKKDAE